MSRASTLFLCLVLLAAAAGAQPGDAVRPVDLPAPDAVLPRADLGEWVTRVQLVWDAVERNLVRRELSAWRNFPGEEVDFLWLPDAAGVPSAGRIEGSGRLIWRRRGSSTADPAAVVAVYRGELVDGRAHGRGGYFHASGFSYEGGWREGLMHGDGHFVSPQGAEILGSFDRGRPAVDSRAVDPFTTLLQADPRRDPAAFSPAPADAAPTVRLAQYSEYSGLRIGVFVAPRLPDDSWEGRLEYKAVTDENNLLVVAPDDDALVRAWLGDRDVMGAGYFLASLSSDAPVEFRLTVHNQSTAPLRIAQAQLAVDESVPALNPLVDVDFFTYPGLCEPSRFPTESGHLDLSARLLDVGWARIVDSRLSLQLGTRFDASAPKGEHRVGALDGSTDLDVGAALAQIGGTSALCYNLLSCDVEALGLETVDGWSLPADYDRGPIERCLSDLRRDGKLGAASSHLDLENIRRVTLAVTARYEYEWIDHENRRRTSSRLFPVKLSLADLVGGYFGAEGAETETFYGNQIELRTAGKGYKVRVPLRATVEAGKERSWSVNLSAPKSSGHEFRFELNIGGEWLATRPVKLTYLRPNVGSEGQVREAFQDLRWIQMASRPSAEAARQEACRLVGSFDQVHVLRAMNGFYAVVAGPFPQAEAEERAASLKRARAIPADSIVTGGERWVTTSMGVRSWDCGQ